MSKIDTKNKTVIDSGMSLYDMNKQLMAKEKPFDVFILRKEINKIISDILYKKKKPYWMLLCKERNDYTVFIPLTLEGTTVELIETLMNRGDILSIEEQKDGNYEIWIRDRITNENFAYYLFDYTDGVIKA